MHLPGFAVEEILPRGPATYGPGILYLQIVQGSNTYLQVGNVLLSTKLMA